MFPLTSPRAPAVLFGWSFGCTRFGNGSSVLPALPGHAVQQLAGVLVPGGREDLRGRSALHDLSVAHDRDLVAYVRGDPQVVGDEEH